MAIDRAARPSQELRLQLYSNSAARPVVSTKGLGLGLGLGVATKGVATTGANTAAHAEQVQADDNQADDDRLGHVPARFCKRVEYITMESSGACTY